MDIFQYLTSLDQERYRIVVLHTSPEKAIVLTNFAKKVCIQADGKYLDLLDLFIQKQELSEQIDRFNADKFRSLLIEQSLGVSLLFVDRTDFLIDTWRKSEKQNFSRMLTNQWDSFKEGMKAKVFICLQTSQEIEAFSILDSHRQSRVMRLSDFNDIL
jgi:hypothetical protein